MLSIVRNSRLLTLIQLDFSDPIGRCLGHCNRFGDGGVNAGADVDTDLLGPRLRILFALKGLNVAIALLVDIVDHPGLLHVAISGLPSSLAYRHGATPLQWLVIDCSQSSSIRFKNLWPLHATYRYISGKM